MSSSLPVQGNTNIMGLPEDLNLKGNEFGNAVTVFFATYVFFDTPCVVALKIIGPRSLLCFCMMAWGLVCLGSEKTQGTHFTASGDVSGAVVKETL